mmetsp:Transcript_36897/g.106431  ORF Transcript_36897/g.106431 Transcript_36897/m.106431 type:complete len:134 (+) Transcript_36897:47-448(+)
MRATETRGLPGRARACTPGPHKNTKGCPRNRLLINPFSCAEAAPPADAFDTAARSVQLRDSRSPSTPGTIAAMPLGATDEGGRPDPAADRGGLPGAEAPLATAAAFACMSGATKRPQGSTVNPRDSAVLFTEE